ncbi:MAG: hypothetical protein ABMA64_02645 [Myxococcota bacterium]
MIIELSGLDGSNPLGFLAAVGLLRWLVDEHGCTDARLWFRPGDWRARIDGAPGVEPLVDAVAIDAVGWLQRAALGFRYEVSKGKEVREVADLKPPPERFRTWLGELRKDRDWTSLGFAAGYASEGGQDRSGMVKPTALHFTAGQQQFLGAVCEIAESLTTDDVREALIGPWRYAREVKSLSWDASVSRDYALRYGNPAKEARQGNPGADWLAFHALPLFPVMARGGQAATAGAGGGWKNGHFRWPLWDQPAGLGAVRSLVVSRDVERWTAAQRRLVGVMVVFASAITRSDQGGYGAFGPAHLAGREDGVGR